MSLFDLYVGCLHVPSKSAEGFFHGHVMFFSATKSLCPMSRILAHGNLKHFYREKKLGDKAVLL